VQCAWVNSYMPLLRSEVIFKYSEQLCTKSRFVVISQRSAPEEQNVYCLTVFISLRAPEERNVLLGKELHAAPTERDNLRYQEL
jgi:hypothetical protein